VGAGRAQAAAGGLDATFGSGGVVNTDFGGPGKSDEIRDLALQPDGKIVAVGHTDQNQADIARYLPNGQLDPSFGDGGRAILTPPGAKFPAAVGIQPGGKIVVADIWFGLFRLTSDGKLDTSFADNGILYSGRLNENRDATFVSHAHVLNDLVVRGDGKIVAVGNDNYATPHANLGSNQMVVGYTADGALDDQFGDRGLVNYTTLTNDARGVVLDAAGKIVVVGSGGGFVSSELRRYTIYGKLDQTFGSDGARTIDLCSGGGGEWLNGVALSPGGKLVVAGSCPTSGLIARFDGNGNIDKAFGSAGVAFPSVSANYRQVVSEPGGEVVVAGADASGLKLSRFGPTGRQDLGYGSKSGALNLIAGADNPHALLIQSDRKVVVGLGAAQLDSIDFGIARFEAGGDIVAPELTVTVPDNAMRIVRRKGRLPVRIDASEAIGVNLDSVLKFKGTHGRKRRVQTDRDFDLSGPVKGKLVSIRIGKSDRSKLHKVRRAKLTLVATVEDRGGNQVKQTLKRTLRLKSAK
jgi:uncharacterized delta-60 repeat protein